MLLTMYAASSLMPWETAPILGSQTSTSTQASCRYTDYSAVQEAISSSSSFSDDDRKTPYEQFFPVKLHTMLAELENEGLGGIIGWRPHGRAFNVNQQEKFVLEVIPK
jgi:hypothetical protein